MPVDKAGNDEPIGWKGARVEISPAIADLEKIAARDDAPVAHDEREIVPRFARHERAGATDEFGGHDTSTPFLTTAAARLPPNSQPNSSGDPSRKATKSAGAPARRLPALRRNEWAAARVTAKSASAAESPKSLRPKCATLCRLKQGEVPGL